MLPCTQAIDEKTLELLRLSTPTDLYELLSFPISYDMTWGEHELAKQLSAITGGCQEQAVTALEHIFRNPTVAGAQSVKHVIRSHSLSF
jgi:hypothetical protein